MLYIERVRESKKTESRPKIRYAIYDRVVRGQVGLNYGPQRYLTGAPQLVCRQHWAETSQTFLHTCTLRVDSSRILRVFLQSQGAIVSQIRRLMVHVPEEDMYHFPESWREALNAALIGRLKNLQGVSLSGLIAWRDRQDIDAMLGSQWEICRLAPAIQPFRQHKLASELTFSDLTYPWGESEWWNKETINKAVRDALLQHHPLRRSKRVRPG